MKRLHRFVATALATALLGACAVTNETRVITGTPRTPTSPEQVKLYTSPPKKFVEIAIVSADAAHDFMSKQALLDKAIQNAKNEAAKVGANGILLENLSDTNLGASGAAIKTKSVVTPVVTENRTGKQISGRAIYVTEE